jgi:hypothetical protein
VDLHKDGACVIGNSSLFAGVGFFKTELGAVVLSEVMGRSCSGREVGFLLIVTMGWACFSGDDVSLMGRGPSIPSSTLTGEAGKECSWVFLDVETSRAPRLSISFCPSFPRTVSPPLKRRPGRLSLARWALTFSSCGDREVLHVLRQGRRTADALAFIAFVLLLEVLVWIAMWSGSDERLRWGTWRYEVAEVEVCKLMKERANHMRRRWAPPIISGAGRCRAGVVVVAPCFLVFF